MLKTEEGFKKVNNMLDISKSSSNVAMDGRKQIKEVIEQYEYVRKTVKLATESVQNLGKRSAEIGNFIHTIKGIAEQTNLLALNASIEAARAGESGRGFSVVAEEIRKLAEDSSKAAETISELIGDSQKETSITIKTAEDNLEKVNRQLALIEKSGDSLETIVAKVKETEENISDMHDIYQEVQDMSEVINQSINEISNIIEDSVAYTEEVAASSEEQHSSMEEVVLSVEKLASLTINLQTEVNKFK